MNTKTRDGVLKALLVIGVIAALASTIGILVAFGVAMAGMFIG